MNRPLIIVLVIFLLHNYLGAQLSLIDSLKTEIQNSKSDVHKSKLYSDLSYEYLYLDFDEGIKCADLSIDLAAKLNNDTLQAFGYNRKGVHYASQRQDSLAFININKALELFQRQKHQKGIGSTAFVKGWLLTERSDYMEAIEVLHTSIIAYDQTNENKRKASSYNSLGSAYLQLGDYYNALNAYLFNLKINEETGNETNIGIVYGNVGMVYNRLKEYDKALEYYNKAQKKYLADNESVRLVDNYGQIANTYDNLNKSEEALKNYALAIQLADSLKYEKGLHSNLLNRAMLYIKESRYSDALTPIQNAAEYFRKVGHNLHAAIAYKTLSELYININDSTLSTLNLTRVDANKRAKNAAYSSLEFSKTSGTKSTIADAYEMLAKAQEKCGLQDSALISYTAFIKQFKENAEVDLENKNASLKLSMNYEEAQRKKTLLAETDKQRTIKMASIIVGNALLFFALISFVLYKKRRDAKAAAQMAQFETTVAETEMKALRAQMNPHFIFNSLNSISVYIQKNQLQLADSYLIKFARLMRLILENSEHQEVSLKKDLEALELYIQLEQLRLNKVFSYTIRVDEKLDLEGTAIPPLLLQPFVENSIWHGVSSIKQGSILIEIKEHNNQLQCIVEDNGIGRSHAQKEKSEIGGHISLGMKITQSRIDILNKSKNENAQMNIFDLEQGTRVVTNLPLIFIY